MRTIRSKKKKDPAIPEPSILDKFSDLISGLFSRFTEQAIQNNDVIIELKKELAKQSERADQNTAAIMAIAESLKTQNEKPVVINLPEHKNDWVVEGFQRDYLGNTESFTLKRIEKRPN